MTKEQNHRGLILGYIAIAFLAIGITGMSISVWAKPYTSTHDTAKAMVPFVTDTTKTLVVTNEAKEVFSESKQVDTLAINAAFLKKMRKNGELLSSDEFASRITDYYNTLVAVLTALFVLFTIVTYMTIRNKFEGKFEDKAREFEEKARVLEDTQRQKIVDELRSMFNDSKRIDEVIKSAVGGHVEDQIATKEEVDGLTSDMEIYGKNIASLATNLEVVKKKQQELFKVVSELQDQVSESAIVCTNLDEEEAKKDVKAAISDDETSSKKGDLNSEQNTTE